VELIIVALAIVAVIALWVGQAGLVSYLAARKGRNPDEWFVFGLLSDWALVAILLLPPAPARFGGSARDRLRRDRQVVTCPNCRATSSAQPACPECGEPLPAFVPVARPAPPQKVEATAAIDENWRWKQ
jgi:hypothetical protein